ncbi:MAG: hypothetical protein HY680_03595 [Chloroflexi bacterium]|nr:hypothetical protein [Chloroflexota bacterium]
MLACTMLQRTAHPWNAQEVLHLPWTRAARCRPTWEGQRTGWWTPRGRRGEPPARPYDCLLCPNPHLLLRLTEVQPAFADDYDDVVLTNDLDADLVEVKGGRLS